MRFLQSGHDDGNIPPEAYQLADHLDAALAAAEDLADAGRRWVPARADVAGYEFAVQMAAERQVIERVHMFETVLIGRVLKARARAQVLARTADDFAGLTRLFVGGTAPLLDAIEELGDSTRSDFETGDCHIAYLRQRGVIAQDAPDLPEDRAITLGDDQFLVAGRIALAPLAEMIIAFLDALDMHYDLYPDDPEGEEPYGWADVVNAARGSDALLDSRAQDGGATSAFLSQGAFMRDDDRLCEVADANAQSTLTSESDVLEHSQETSENASATRLPLKSPNSISLVDRLGEIARALE